MPPGDGQWPAGHESPAGLASTLATLLVGAGGGGGLEGGVAGSSLAGEDLAGANMSESEELKLLNFPPRREDLSTAIPLTLIFGLLLLTGCIGNICTAIVIARPRNKYMHTATNYYLFSLALSDFLFLTLGLPQEMYTLWQRYPYAFGEHFCIIRGYLSEASTYASILTISAFTMERYVAICHPLWAHTMSQLPRAITSIVIIWCLAAVCAIPPAAELGIVTQVGPITRRHLEQSAQCASKRVIYENMFVVSAIVFFIVPMIIVTVLYILIAIELRRSSRMSSNMKRQQDKLRVTSNGASSQQHQQLAAAAAASGCCTSAGPQSHCCCQHAHFAHRPPAPHERPASAIGTEKGNLLGGPRAATAAASGTRAAVAVANQLVEAAEAAAVAANAGANSNAQPAQARGPPTPTPTATPTPTPSDSSASSRSAICKPRTQHSPLSYHESLIARQLLAATNRPAATKQRQVEGKNGAHCVHQSSLSQLQVLNRPPAAQLGPRPTSALASMLNDQQQQQQRRLNLSHSQQTLGSALSQPVQQQQQQTKRNARSLASSGGASSKKSVIRMLGKYSRPTRAEKINFSNFLSIL